MNHYIFKLNEQYCATSNRIGKYEPLYFQAKRTINLDHHATNSCFADNNLVLKTSSTCEALYILAKIKNYVISDEVCNLIYCSFSLKI